MSIITQFLNWLETALQSIGLWAKPALTAGEKVYNELSDEEKKAAQWSYGVIAIINQHANEINLILPLIQKIFPGLTSDVLQGFLERLLAELHVVDDNVPLTLEDAIKAAANYLKSLQGNTWATISQAAGNILLTLLSPSTPIQKAMTIAEFVYQSFIKPYLAK